MKKAKSRKKTKSTKRHLTIETPCCLNDIESFLRMISNIGHWHDAIVKTKNNTLIVEYTDDTIDQLSSTS